MYAKSMMAALLLGALCLAPAFGDGKGDEGGAVERQCQFETEVPVVLAVSPCIEFKDDKALLLVLTNTRTIVCFENTDFSRHERDCEGNPLETVDTIPADVEVSFLEVILCQDGGAPLEVKELPGDCWCVNPHRGGYIILFDVDPAGEFDLCDDAGCYTAEVTVIITAEPFEDCEDVRPE